MQSTYLQYLKIRPLFAQLLTLLGIKAWPILLLKHICITYIYIYIYISTTKSHNGSASTYVGVYWLADLHDSECKFCGWL